MTALELIESALNRLADRPGFIERPAQRQLALWLGDMMEGGHPGAVEAPTGLGKSLAALIPALAHGIASGKRSIVATYTNILAEQYWRKDLPLALSLFEDTSALKVEYLIGRQRYICREQLGALVPEDLPRFPVSGIVGVESDFLQLTKLKAKPAREMWPQVSVPPVCAARACPDYNECYYYRARERAAEAHVVITNHSVVIQHALMASVGDGKGLLGKYDYLVLDEAHDFLSAAQSGLEFELSGRRLNVAAGVAGRVERELLSLAEKNGQGLRFQERFAQFRQQIDGVRRALMALKIEIPQAGILAVSPQEVADHPSLKPRKVVGGLNSAEGISDQAAQACESLCAEVVSMVEGWNGATRVQMETLRNSTQFLTEFALQSRGVLDPHGVSVSFSAYGRTDAMLRLDTVDVSQPLKDMIWDKGPATCLSATLAVDQAFDFFQKQVGFESDFTEILPTPFDFAGQCSLYLPPAGRIPDPSIARQENNEDLYFREVAREVGAIIAAMGGRTLVLFHSKREMEAVYQRVRITPDLPILVQGQLPPTVLGDRFKRDVRSSLFGVRSFWTGFDAPGETLSCVVIVRVPFEVPVEPAALVRMAHLHHQGENPFQAYSLPMAKMMVRQGAGRLMRRDSDRGVIALLDPRIRSKFYGESILENLPNELRRFDDFVEAMAWVGLEPST